MVSSRWIASQKETTFGTAEFNIADDPAEHIKPGIVEGDIEIPWNKQEHEPLHDITSVKPVSATKKAIKVDHEIDYLYTNAGVWRRFFGAATHADNVSTFKFPAAFSATVDSWSWNFRTGAKSVNLLGGVTQKVSLFIEEFQPVKIKESIIGQRVVEGTVFTKDPIFPGTTDDLPYFFNHATTKTMGGTAMATLKLAHFEFLQQYTPETGSVNAYCNRIVRGYSAACLFNLTSTYNGSTDALRDKLLADSKEDLVINLIKTTDVHYTTITLASTVYTGLAMKTLENGTILYTVSGYAYPSGADYVSIAVREGIDWST